MRDEAARPGGLGGVPQGEECSAGACPLHRSGGGHAPALHSFNTVPALHWFYRGDTGRPLAGIGTQIHFQRLLRIAQLGAEA